MGLDMYLYKKLYCKNWEHMKKAEKHTITVKLGGKLRKDVKPERISEITEQVMYWRKANAIHKWFVDNVQGGMDDCKEYYVERDQLMELRDLCQKVVDSTSLVDGDVVESYGYEQDGVDAETGQKKWKKVPNLVKGKVMADPSVAMDLLPTQSGFFFGHTEYDEWYYSDIKRTAEELTALLDEPQQTDKYGGTASYYYQSSW